MLLVSIFLTIASLISLLPFTKQFDLSCEKNVMDIREFSRRGKAKLWLVSAIISYVISTLVVMFAGCFQILDYEPDTPEQPIDPALESRNQRIDARR